MRAAVGGGVDPTRLGERVAIPWLGAAWCTCEHCVSGWETLRTRSRDEVREGHEA